MGSGGTEKESTYNTPTGVESNVGPGGRLQPEIIINRHVGKYSHLIRAGLST